jgi:hypothetical protein
MAGKTNYLEGAQLNAYLRRLSTTAQGGSSGTSLVVASSTGFLVGDIIKCAGGTPANWMGQVAAIPDGTHLTLAYAPTTTATSGAVDRWAYSPTGIHVGLFTAAPTDAGGGTEVSGGNYARQQITQADASWAAPSGTPRSTNNSSDVTWASVTWSGTVVAWGIFDATTTGNLLAWYDCTDQAVASGNTVKIVATSLTWQED